MMLLQKCEDLSRRPDPKSSDVHDAAWQLMLESICCHAVAFVGHSSLLSLDLRLQSCRLGRIECFGINPVFDPR